MQTRQQRRFKQQSSRGKDKRPERFSSYTIRPNATTKSKRVNPGICTSRGISKKKRNSKCVASSSEEMATAKRSCSHTYNLRSTKYEPGKCDERKRFKHERTLSGSSGRDASESLRLKKSFSSRAVSQTFSIPSQEPSIVARKLRSHNIKTRTDPAISCWITGIAITNDGRILVVDRNYGTVKAFYRSMELQSSLRLYEYIWDITIINNNEAVVGTESTESKKYFVLDISGNQLQVTRTHPLPFNVYATCRFNDKLVAVTRDSCQAVKMFDMSGKVHWTLSEDHFGHSLYPIYVTTKSYDREQSVIVVDQKMNAVLLINGDDGKIKKTVRGIGKSPQGVTIDSDGNVYICLFEDNKIIVLSADLSEQKVLLTKQDRLREYPQAIAYDKNTHCLLISYMYCDFLDIFEIF